jgi:hypothetical protein
LVELSLGIQTFMHESMPGELRNVLLEHSPATFVLKELTGPTDPPAPAAHAQEPEGESPINAYREQLLREVLIQSIVLEGGTPDAT